MVGVLRRLFREPTRCDRCHRLGSIFQLCGPCGRWLCWACYGDWDALSCRECWHGEAA